MTVTEKIDSYIDQADDWSGELLREFRKLVHQTIPEITEEYKWNRPVFSYHGKMICSPSAFKKHVGINFFDGALLEDSDSIFTSGLDSKKMRSIQIKKQDQLPHQALQKLLLRAVELHKK